MYRMTSFITPNHDYQLLGERQEAQILKFNAPPLHT